MACWDWLAPGSSLDWQAVSCWAHRGCSYRQGVGGFTPMVIEFPGVSSKSGALCSLNQLEDLEEKTTQLLPLLLFCMYVYILYISNLQSVKFSCTHSLSSSVLELSACYPGSPGGSVQPQLPHCDTQDASPRPVCPLNTPEHTPGMCSCM